MSWPDFHGNNLLRLLPEADAVRLTERAERVRVPLGGVISEPDGHVTFAHFPLSNLFSSVVALADGSQVEAATVGSEGMAPVGLLASETGGAYRVMQQIDGESLRVPVADFRARLAEDGPLRRVMERYALAMIQQSGQSAACNVRHEIGPRLCRWLLATQDGVGRGQFFLTHEFAGMMLGVRRQSVSSAAGALQRAGLIRYERGAVTVLDRPGLERASCECYGAIRAGYSRAMRPTIW